MLLDSSTASGGDALVGFVELVLIVAFYFVPTLVASGRHTVNKGGVFVINLFLGWTAIGWIVALAMAAGGQTQTQAAASRQVTYVQAAPQAPQVSPDGRFWWDGRQWQPMPGVQAVAPSPSAALPSTPTEAPPQ